MIGIHGDQKIMSNLPHSSSFLCEESKNLCPRALTSATVPVPSCERSEALILGVIPLYPAAPHTSKQCKKLKNTLKQVLRARFISVTIGFPLFSIFGKMLLQSAELESRDNHLP